jgi:hypothetical protein
MFDSLHPVPTERLIQNLLSGHLTQAEAEQLLTKLVQNPSLGAELLDHLQTDEMLLEISKSEKQSLSSSVDHNLLFSDRLRGVEELSHPQMRIKWINSPLWATAFAACVALLAGLYFYLSSKPVVLKQQVINESTTRAVVTLTREVNAEWAGIGETHSVGEALEPRWLRLKAGVAQIEFYNGARVLLEGPVEFQVVSAKEAFCRSGKLSAEAPPSAHGFCIRTPQLNVVDLGTAFGVDVSSSGSAVQVFKGEVELHDQLVSNHYLKEGEAVSVAPNGVPHYFLASHVGFMSISELEHASFEEQLKRHQSWLSFSAQLNTDPSLVVHFDFEKLTPYEDLLHNSAANTLVGDATIVGCSLGSGRWQDKNALEYSGVSSRVLLNVPGEFKSLTYAAWVRVNSLNNYYNSLIMCDGFKDGAAHWQILFNGVVRLGVANTNSSTAHAHDTHYDTPVIFTPERLGQWIHLAAVYDAVAKRVTQYVNGEVVMSQPLQFETPLRLGPTQIGNWNRGDYTVDVAPIRNFSGRMDDFEFFSRPLSDNEIRALYQESSPENNTVNNPQVVRK